jgi:putative intracellular protease/amidase
LVIQKALVGFFVDNLIPAEEFVMTLMDSTSPGLRFAYVNILVYCNKLPMKSTKVLFVATSHDKVADTNEETGLWLEELAAPYYIFKEAGGDIKLASPAGGRVPLDPKSQSIILATFSTKRFLKDEEAMNLLSNSIPLGTVKDGDFDVIFLPGGNGLIWDLANSSKVRQLLEVFYSKNKPIGATSQGVACLLSLKNNKEKL